MERDPRAYLWDMQAAAEAIVEFAAGKTLDEYLEDRMLRSAVERQFEIIGEALNQLCKLDPQWTVRIPDAPQITRVPVSIIASSLAGGMSMEDIEREYEVTREQIEATPAFANDLVQQESVHILPHVA